MLYRDLVQFTPIETVIQLRDADDKAEARQLVQSYVISARMADLLVNVVFPQLQVDRPIDNKGVLIVGNYGTGKSHLMSVLSALAEHADLAPLVSNAAVRAAAGAVAGRFQVVRAEIGGVERSLRDIVLGELEHFFARVGTPYTFPAASTVTNNKEALIAAMAGFQAKYPNQGVLFVLDELLDYLRSREERALILDLGVLRELGEVAAATPFRFLAGVQETLFDNPRFGFVAEQLRRVRDRFEQVRIAREDIAFVVAERLLQKTDAQLAQISTHLRRFTPLYPPLAERPADFARLFPIHPAYIDTFERVYLAEKREVLRTFSRAIQARLDEPVPTDQPGTISYDDYWRVLTGDPGLRTLPGVAEVVEKNGVLEGRIQNAYTRPALRDMALRIIHALGIHRLTTADLNAPLGVTAEELRDQLFLWAKMPEPNADFLADTVRVALKEIMRTVSGQFISENPDNGQYYLNLSKVVDFDARIAERGGFMEARDLNRYFYDAVRQMMNLSTTTYITGRRIWPYQLPWEGHKVTRPGYLFFTPPDERTTAQPPRDFYLYLMPPFDPQPQQSGHNADEVIFALADLDESFETLVRRYAGAQALAHESPQHRAAYDDKAGDHLRALRRWLDQHFTTQLRVTHGGRTRTVAEALARTRSSASRDLNELVQVIGAHLLAPHFQERYPEYPAFRRLTQPVTEENRGPNAMDAVRFLARGSRTNLALGVLDGLGLLDAEERVRTANSPYAQYFLGLLQGRGPTQVVNHGEIIAQTVGGLTPVYKDPRFGLEPEWVVVVLLALVYEGQSVLNVDGKEVLDAGTIERATLRTIEDLADFRFYRRPRELPEQAWARIFEAFGLPPGRVRDEAHRDEAVRALQEGVAAELGQVVRWQSAVQGGLTLWNTPLFTDAVAFTDAKDGLVTRAELPAVPLRRSDLEPYLRTTKSFLETLSRFNTGGKLRNLQLAAPDVDQALADRARARRVPEVLDALAALGPPAGYLSTAAAVLPADDPWIGPAAAVRDALLDDVRRLARGEAALDLVGWRKRLEELRRAYVARYSALHRRDVLDKGDDERRARLLRDRRAQQAQALSRIEILRAAEFERWAAQVRDLPVCLEFHEGLLADSPLCPRCRYRPPAVSTPPARARLDALDDQLDTLLAGWHAALRHALASQSAQDSRAAMTTAERAPLEAYLAPADPAAGPLPPGLVEAANSALRGLRTLGLSPAALLAALHTGGLPCTVEQLHERFNGYLAAALRGQDSRATRLTFAEEDADVDP